MFQCSKKGFFFVPDQPTYSRNTTKKSPSSASNDFESTDVAQKKFGTAKGISSQQFFGDEASSYERSANLAKFQGSNSISSADYFGHGSPSGGGGRLLVCFFNVTSFWIYNFDFKTRSRSKPAIQRTRFG